MKKFILSFLVFATGATLSYAQNPADLLNSSAVAETQNVQSELLKVPEEALTESMNASLSKQGKALGTINSRKLVRSHLFGELF